MKKKIALAAILAATVTLTGCKFPIEVKIKTGDDSSVTDSEKSSKNDESSKPSDKPDDSKPGSSSKPSSGNSAYEPVTMNCGEIISSGDVQFFECSSKYGSACEVIYRYIFANGKFDGVLLWIKPGEVKELNTILENTEDGTESYNASDFTEIISGWTLRKEAFEFEPTFQNMSIDSLYSLMQMSMLTANDPNPGSSDNSDSENSKPGSKPNYGEVDFEPVVTTVGDIVERAGGKFFEVSTRYGNACTVVYRYMFENDIFSDSEMRIEPGALTELEQIINDNWYRLGEAGAFEADDFTKFANTWVLTKEGWNDEANAFFEGAEINMLRALLQMQYE